MEKKLFGLMMFAFMLMFPILVNAEEVGTLEKFTECVTGTGNSCKLTADVTLDAVVDVTGNIVLDLNGHSVTLMDNVNTNLGVLIVHNGATLVINDSVGTGKITTGNTTTYTAILLTKTDDDASKVASVTVNGGMLEGYWYGISGNGSRHNTNVVINGGEVVGKNGMGIYHPQIGTAIVNGGTISGKTGIEMRSGILKVTGGTIIGTDVPATVRPNGSGATSLGAGVAIAQHTTLNAIDVTVSGGKIQGYSAIYESNPQGNSAEAIAKVSIKVTGGTLEAINDGQVVVYSENDLVTIEASASEIFKTEENELVYGIVNENGEVSYIQITEELGKELEEKLLIDETTVDVIDETEVELVEEVVADKKYTVVSYYDINLELEHKTSGSSVKVQEVNNLIKVTLDIPKGLDKVKDGYVRNYVIIRIHNGKTSVLEAVDNGDGTLSFGTDKFSTYVVAYEDVVESVEVPADTTKNPGTYDRISSIMIVACLSLVSLLAVALYAKNKKLFN